jgi:hypothetical protein
MPAEAAVAGDMVACLWAIVVRAIVARAAVVSTMVVWDMAVRAAVVSTMVV